MSLNLPCSFFSKNVFPSQTLDREPSISQADNVSNPIPLPPKEGKSHVTAGKRHVRKNPLILTSGAAASMARKFETDDSNTTSNVDNQPITSNILNRIKNTHHFSPNNDAFEEEIAYSIDALDDIPDSKYNSPKVSLEQQPGDHADHSVESDEVRIMSKVLGGVSSADTAGCVQALDMTDWNVHRAIKLVKLKALIRKPGVKDNDMKVRLMSNHNIWVK